MTSPAAGSISNTDATLDIEDYFTGSFFVTAVYRRVPNRADTTRYFMICGE
ncbi:hypothetical protein JW859_14550 [bacterium]|nr:hypothetical protein [bacterium]